MSGFGITIPSSTTGGGDMNKAVYDTNSNNIADKAEILDNGVDQFTVNELTNIQNSSPVTFTGTTSDNTITEIFVDGVNGNRYLLEDNKATSFFAQISAYNNIDKVGKMWIIHGLVERNGTNVSIIGTTKKAVISEDGNYNSTFNTNNWDVIMEADNINQTLNIKTQGENTKNINWIAKVQFTIS